MEVPFKVGSVVMQRDGSPRMKVAAIDESAGRIRCTWTQGPAKYSQMFDAKDLIVSAMRPVTYQPPVRRR